LSAAAASREDLLPVSGAPLWKKKINGVLLYEKVPKEVVGDLFFWGKILSPKKEEKSEKKALLSFILGKNLPILEGKKGGPFLLIRSFALFSGAEKRIHSQLISRGGKNTQLEVLGHREEGLPFDCANALVSFKENPFP